MSVEKFKTIRIEKKTFYRTVDARWETTVLEDGPSFASGGRFNPAYEFGAVYFSSNAKSSFFEWLRDRNINEVCPYVTLAFEITLSKVANLTSEKDSKVMEWHRGGYKGTHDLARRFYEEGSEGVIYRSVRVADDTENLAIFPSNILKSGCIKLLRRVSV